MKEGSRIVVTGLVDIALPRLKGSQKISRVTIDAVLEANEESQRVLTGGKRRACGSI